MGGSLNSRQRIGILIEIKLGFDGKTILSVNLDKIGKYG
jgi:hypothetical protein